VHLIQKSALFALRVRLYFDEAQELEERGLEQGRGWTVTCRDEEGDWFLCNWRNKALSLA